MADKKSKKSQSQQSNLNNSELGNEDNIVTPKKPFGSEDESTEKKQSESFPGDEERRGYEEEAPAEKRSSDSDVEKFPRGDDDFRR
jgi:hypothetical protein